MARTRYTATGNNEDNTNPFVPPSFPIPSPGRRWNSCVPFIHGNRGRIYTDRWDRGKIADLTIPDRSTETRTLPRFSLPFSDIPKTRPIVRDAWKRKWKFFAIGLIPKSFQKRSNRNVAIKRLSRSFEIRSINTFLCFFLSRRTEEVREDLETQVGTGFRGSKEAREGEGGRLEAF